MYIVPDPLKVKVLEEYKLLIEFKDGKKKFLIWKNI